MGLLLSFNVHLYHIAYSYDTLNSMPDNFLVLDNLNNERPDWFEYWPIRNFLLSSKLNDNDFYGFFSPKFVVKTGLNANLVKEFIGVDNGNADCYIFSPQPDMSGLFINVFEQGEAFDVGTIDAFKEVLKHFNLNADIKNMIMDSRKIVFSNYFVAKPEFWRLWLNINEYIFMHAEDYKSDFGKLLRSPTSYSGAQRKVFIQERTASLILNLYPHWKSHRYNPFKFVWSGTPLNQFIFETIISDALKIAFNETKDHEYISAYSYIRSKILNLK